MTAAVVVGVLVGVGCIGVVAGLRDAPPSLALTLERVGGQPAAPVSVDAGSTRLGRSAARWLTGRGHLNDARLSSLRPALAVTGESLEQLVSRIFVAGAVALLAPPVLWAVAAAAGISAPLAIPVLASVVLVPLGIALPVAGLTARARERRAHFRVVIGTFVDLVVLGLAGGVGIEGALFAASQVSSDWAARRIARVLASARDSGRSPWAALGELGEEVGVTDLVELSATLQLAGTEGARVRQALRARAVSLRRHEQADAESAANATTERLFVPGALLLIGFLIFVGYPAFTRIMGGL